MRMTALILLSMFLPAAGANEVYFVGLKEFRQWPSAAQQAYILGIVDQALADAYQFDSAAYNRIVQCMGNVDTSAMFQSTLDAVLKEKFDDTSLTLLIGDGIHEFCEKSGYKLD